MTRFRVREIDQMKSVNQKIGQFYWTNKGSVRHAGDFFATTGPGLYRKCFDETHGRPPYRTGGPFFNWIWQEPVNAVGGGNFVGRVYVGPGNSVIGAVKPGDEWRFGYNGAFTYTAGGWALGADAVIPSDFDSHRPMDPDDLSSLGGRAYGRLRPKVEKAGLMQAVVELRDAPRMLEQTGKAFLDLWKDGSRLAKAHAQAQNGKSNLKTLKDLRSARPKELADQFLNVRFGWIPFVKEVHDVCNVVVNFDNFVEKAEANNDKWMQRKFFEDVVETEEELGLARNQDGTACNPFLGADIVVPKSGVHRIARQRVTRVWYKGSFKYYRPEFDRGLKSGLPGLRKAQQALTLLGGNITPTHLFNVVPWTWLGNWFAGMSDAVQRLEDAASGGVVARYFYVMRNAMHRFEFTNSFSTYGGQQPDLKWYRSVETQRRIGSESAFLFSLNPQELTGMQYAILAALGIGRA